MPVGSAGPADGGGIATTKDCLTPAPSYSVDVCVWLLATHIGPVGASASPQGLMRLGSVAAAITEPSETRLVCEKAVAAFTVSAAVCMVLALYAPPEQFIM